MYEVDGGILKCGYIRCSSSETSTLKTAEIQTYINIRRDVSVISLIVVILL